MEAKDTLISLEQVTLSSTQYPASEVARAQMIADYKKLTKQADISFKAGIKEVVEWIKQYHGLDFEEAKAKLEEWGIV